MLAGALVVLTLIAAPPPDQKKELSAAAKSLRVAWASQYEWREDGIKNVTLPFAWEHKSVDENDDELVSKGGGHAVLVGNETRRVHIVGARAGRTSRDIDNEVRWVIARYARKSFEEAFKDAKITDGGETVAGSHKVRAKGVTYYLKNDRIIAQTREIGTKKNPLEVRVDFKLEEMGDGYARVTEFYVRRSDSGKKRATTRKLTSREGGELPLPETSEFRQDRGKRGSVTVTITFAEPKTNTEHPVVIEPKTEALLREAWINRYVFPEDIRIVSDFDRKPGRSLLKSGWTVVKGKLLVWGMDSVEVELDGSGARGRGGRAARLDTCERHMRLMLGFFRDTPFEEQFKDCGFRLVQTGKTQVVEVYGNTVPVMPKPPPKAPVKKPGVVHTPATAFLIEGDFIVGYRPVLFLGAGSWVYLKVKKDKNGKGLIRGLSTTADGKKLAGKWTYARMKGIQIPRKFEILVVPEYGRPFTGVCAYTLKRTKVTLPGG